MKAISEWKIIELNPFQWIAAVMSRKGKKFKLYRAGRGAGKSTILGWDMMILVSMMPRATGVLVGETYQQILSRTLPSTKEGLEQFGVYEEIDYVVGRKGKGFRMPFQAPNNWNNVIHFRNGTIVVMVSLDMPNAGRGLNSYWVIGDEAALFNKERLFNNVQTTNRSYKEEFSKCPLINSEIWATSMPLTKGGKWILEMEKIYREDKFYKGKSAYIKAPSKVNKQNLTAGWLERMEAEASSQIIFDAEINDIEPPSVLNGFYKHWSDKNTYSHAYDVNYLLETVGVDYAKKYDTCRQDADLLPDVPLSISIDPGLNINSMTVWQYNDVKFEDRCINEFFVKGQKDHHDLVKEFDMYYAIHRNRNNTVYLYHDVSAYKQKDQNNIKISTQIELQLNKLGWRVVNMTPNSNNPGHDAKYYVLNTLLQGSKRFLPKIKVNRDHCINLIISIEGAETDIKKNSGFSKDKKSELDKSILPEHATHLSDTFDYYLYWKYYIRMDNETSQKTSTMPIGGRRR